jgi:hypothetical protein
MSLLINLELKETMYFNVPIRDVSMEDHAIFQEHKVHGI